MKKLFWITMLMVACKSPTQKTADDAYERFKSEIAKDSLSPFARSSAEDVLAFSTDEDKKNEAEVWMKKFKAYIESGTSALKLEKRTDERFMEFVLAPARSFIMEKKCNYMHVHLIVKLITHNQDSIKKAVAILTNDYWNTIPFSENCNPNTRCGVYLYEETADGKDPIQGAWIIAGTRITGQEPEVLFNSDWK